ncbi:M48 family metallopeptidase [bacterium]|nr:M48 family metallopeptidase [bacterium]
MRKFTFEEFIYLKIKGVEIPIEIKRFSFSSGLKLLGKGNDIRVTTSDYITKKRIKEILKPYKEKIYERYMEGLYEEFELQEKKDNLEIKAYLEGELTPVECFDSRIYKYSARYMNHKILLPVNPEELNYENIYQQLDIFYDFTAKRFLPEAFEQYLVCFSYKEKPTLRIKKMIRQWGNCKSSTKVITLNSHLIKLPPELRSYVVFHELVHLIHPNHGKEFYSIIEHKFPLRLELDKELKKWSFVLRDNYVEEYPSEKSG